MQISGPSVSDRDPSIHFSTIHHTRVAQAQNVIILGADAAYKGSVGSQTLTTTPTFSQPGADVPPEVGAFSAAPMSVLQRPELALQSPSHVTGPGRREVQANSFP